MQEQSSSSISPFLSRQQLILKEPDIYNVCYVIGYRLSKPGRWFIPVLVVSMFCRRSLYFYYAENRQSRCAQPMASLYMELRFFRKATSAASRYLPLMPSQLTNKTKTPERTCAPASTYRHWLTSTRAPITSLNDSRVCIACGLNV
jgi:hypothetical protein